MYDELIAELRQHHCDAKEDDTQEVCEECAYDVIIACESVPSGIASVCVCGLMNRAADAIEELSKLADAIPHVCECCIGCELEKKNGGCDNAFVISPKRAMQYLIKPRWIPVTERLPDENGKYLTVFTLNTIPPRPVIEVSCYAKDLYKIDKYDFHDKKRKHGFYQYDSECGYFEMSDISHWMPIPEPPRDGER